MPGRILILNIKPSQIFLLVFNQMKRNLLNLRENLIILVLMTDRVLGPT